MQAIEKEQDARGLLQYHERLLQRTRSKQLRLKLRTLCTADTLNPGRIAHLVAQVVYEQWHPVHRTILQCLHDTHQISSGFDWLQAGRCGACALLPLFMIETVTGAPMSTSPHHAPLVGQGSDRERVLTGTGARRK